MNVETFKFCQIMYLNLNSALLYFGAKITMLVIVFLMMAGNNLLAQDMWH